VTLDQNADYKEEASLLNRGFNSVAGVDEVGRGTVAGPLVVGIAVLAHNPSGNWLTSIKDSKLLSSKKRVSALETLQDKKSLMATGSSSPNEIDKFGIVKATSLATNRAISALGKMPDILLVDGFTLPGITLQQKPIIKGDRKCLSIAAASIIAKVTRDEFMKQQHDIYPDYGFDSNKGYLTKTHSQAIQKHGPCAIHRYSFEPISSITTPTLFDPDNLK
jgi:ribonuclease HII